MAVVSGKGGPEAQTAGQLCDQQSKQLQQMATQQPQPLDQWLWWLSTDPGPS